MPTTPVTCLLCPLLLLAACGPAPHERARASALHMLAHERHPPVKPARSSLQVYDLPKNQVRYFTSDVAPFGAGYLVTYTAAGDSVRGARRALFVADNDSVFFLLPARHAAEFARRFGVPRPAAAPDSAAARRP